MCVNHDLLKPYEPLYEREGERVARFLYTVILMPAGPLRLTEDFFAPATVQSDKRVQDPVLLALLDTPVRKTKAAKAAK